MPITKNPNRQELITAFVDFTFADIPTTATAYDALDLPVGAVVTGGDLVVTTAWNSTTATFQVGDVTLASRYSGAVDLKSAARTALTVTGFTHTAVEKVLKGANIITGTATAGAARLTVTYFVKGRAAFSQG